MSFRFGFAALAASCVIFLPACSTKSNGVATSPSVAPAADIVSLSDGIKLGAGWYPYEQFNGENFRWVRNDAEVLVCPDQTHRTLTLAVEPGPSLGSKSMTLEVFGKGSSPQRFTVPDRRPVAIKIDGATAQTLRLHALSRNLMVPNEKRTLNFRVFSASVGSTNANCGSDIVRDGSPLRLGSGWYALEKSGGQSFHWVDNDAQVRVLKPAASAVLEADVEPGPGLDGKPLQLTVAGARGQSLGRSEEVVQRSFVRIPVGNLHSNDVLTLKIQSPRKQAPGDPRILNYRVFELKLR